MLLASLLLAAAPTTLLPQPDVIPNGHRAVRHELVLETAPGLEGYKLVGAPMRGFGGVDVLTDGEPFTFSSKYGTRFYALPVDEEVPGYVASFQRDEQPELAARWDAYPSWSPPVSEVSLVRDGEPLRRVLTEVRWESLEADGLVVVGESRFDSGGELLETWALADDPTGGARPGTGSSPTGASTPLNFLGIIVIVVMGLGLLLVLVRRGS